MKNEMNDQRPVPADFDGLYEEYAGILEDFWGRRNNTPSYTKTAAIFGHPLIVVSNDQRVLPAIDSALLLYSTAAPVPADPFHIQITVKDGIGDCGTPPPDLFPIIQYTGDSTWLMIHMGAWGHAFIDLAVGRAWVTVTPQLADEPRILSLGLINTIFTNFLIGHGYAMLHTSGLMKGDRLLLLTAPHNTGKSTTALRLALAGYKFVSDSQLYVSPYQDELQITGFPIGRVKLRGDMVSAFPQFKQHLTTEKVQVRDETKYVVNLRQVAPEMMVSEAIFPKHIDLCLLSRGNGEEESRIMPASPAEVRHTLMQNSIFYDTRQVWRANWKQVERVIAQATPHHLIIGTSAAHIVQTVDNLLRET